MDGMTYADPESFVRGDPTLTTFLTTFFFFSLMRGGRNIIPLFAGRHRPASETPSNFNNVFDNVFFCCCFLSGEEGTKIPLLAGHHRPASETSFKLRFTGVPMVTLN